MIKRLDGYFADHHTMYSQLFDDKLEQLKRLEADEECQKIQQAISENYTVCAEVQKRIGTVDKALSKDNPEKLSAKARKVLREESRQLQRELNALKKSRKDVLFPQRRQLIIRPYRDRNGVNVHVANALAKWTSIQLLRPVSSGVEKLYIGSLSTSSGV